MVCLDVVLHFPELVFTTLLLRIVVDVDASGLPHVLELS